MKLTKLALAITFIITNAVLARAQQNFTKVYFQQGYYYPYGFVELPDSGFIVAGAIGTLSVAKNSIIFQISNNGDSIFYHKYDSVGRISSAEPLNDSIILFSRIISLYNGHVNFSLYNFLTHDTIQFVKYFFPTDSKSYIVNAHYLKNGDYVLTNNWAGQQSVMRVDSSGNIKWTSGSTMLFNKKCVEDYDGNIILLGDNGTALKTSHLQKMDSAGNLIWHQSYGNNWQYFSGYTIGDFVQTNDSNYLISCATDDYHLIKIDRFTGDTIWTRTTDSYDYGITNIIRGHNNYYVGLGLRKMYFFDENGDTVFTKSYNLPSNGSYEFSQLLKTKDGGYAFCGWYQTTGMSHYLIIVCKTDSLGNTIFTSQIELPQQDVVSVYPNPANEYVTFAWPTAMQSKQVTLTIYDAQGIVQLQKIIAPQEQIDINQLANGIYNAVISNRDRQMHTRFVVVR